MEIKPYSDYTESEMERHIRTLNDPLLGAEYEEAWIILYAHIKAFAGQQLDCARFFGPLAIQILEELVSLVMDVVHVKIVGFIVPETGCVKKFPNWIKAIIYRKLRAIVSTRNKAVAKMPDVDNDRQKPNRKSTTPSEDSEFVDTSETGCKELDSIEGEEEAKKIFTLLEQFSKASRRNEVIAKVLTEVFYHALNEPGLTKGQLADQTGISRAMLYRYIEEFKDFFGNSGQEMQ